MESVDIENSRVDADKNEGAKSSQSAENFQKFMYELFEKNGVMNDLRSYLRGHIVNVLRSAQTGDPPSCHKHFTQRLELTFQALNILIAEYLMRLEFSYTLSVFVSEIPLANMVFAFAKTLMENVDIDDSRPRFKDSDVWCILNYLGVKCDSEHASSIVEMYRLDQNSPLLLCILKSAPLFKEPIVTELINSSQESSASNKSSESIGQKSRTPQRKPSYQEKCRHYVYCKTCQSKMTRIKEKYKKKKKDIVTNIKESSLNSLNVESLMKNISLMERSLIDEMFDQLKSVYEAEMELMKEEEGKRVKRTLATHSTQLQKRRDEMEESFKAREAELEKNVQQKKRFLWGLARALRDQHQHMTRAMHDVRAETSRLCAKEDSLKSQLAEAEAILRQRGEDMRNQISEELVILEGHLESMKRERDSINRERMQLEQYKDRTVKHIENEDLKPHYDLLKNELAILKKYLETVKLEPKCVIERSTMTELDDVTSSDVHILNNGMDAERRSEEERAKPKQVINDLKKPKNVNFSQSNLDEIYRERSRSRSRSSASSEAGDAQFDTERDSIQQLRDENEELRCFARQQREHIDSLASQQARLQAELVSTRMRTAPAPAPASVPRPRTAPNPALYAFHAHNQRMSASASVSNFSHGWRKGAGEELSFFSNAQPRILVPGDAIPFVGVVTRHNDNRRYLINQWRTLRRRMSPQGARPRPSSTQRNLTDRPEAAGPSVRIRLEQVEDTSATPSQANITEQTFTPEYHRTQTCSPDKSREKSPKSMLREAKEKLRNKDNIVKNTPTAREKSPNCVLREAKLRLRKLEIEAEAVEKSYLDFRRKQEAFRGETDARNESRVAGKDLEIKTSTSTYRLDETYTKESTSHYQQPKPTNEYDRYFKEYHKTGIADFFKNKNTAVVRTSPIPHAYSTQEPKKSENYIETPLTEFRKYYHTARYSDQRPTSPTSSKSPNPVSKEKINSTKGTRKELVRQAKNDKIKELELLKHNIGKIYNMPEQAIIGTPTTNESINENDNEWKESKNDLANEQNSIENDVAVVESNNADINLRIEVESVSEINDLKGAESQAQPGMLLIVESSVDNNRDAEISGSETGEKISTQMTILISPKRSIPGKGFSEPKDESVSERSVRNKTPPNESISESVKSSRKGSLNSPRKDIKSPRKGMKSPRKFSSDSSNKVLYRSENDMTSKNVVAIVHSDEDDRLSGVQMELNLSKNILDNTISELEQNEDPDYPDDFSADVDNYNSRSEYENQSRIISPQKTSADENFWDS